jgi:methionyl-tRNA formyltransferase
MTPDSCNEARLAEDLRAVNPDVMVVVAYGRVLPEHLLAIPRLAVNVHFSLLPHLRGAAPVAKALQWGFRSTGVVVQVLAPELDAGDVLSEQVVPIWATDNAGSLTQRLVVTGTRLLHQVLCQFRYAQVPAGRQQLAAAVTYAPKATSYDAVLCCDTPATLTACQTRAMAPKPGSYCIVDGKRLKILEAWAIWRAQEAAPAGTVIEASRVGPRIAWGGQILVVRLAQSEGGRVLPGEVITAGRLLSPGYKVASRSA